MSKTNISEAPAIEYSSLVARLRKQKEEQDEAARIAEQAREIEGANDKSDGDEAGRKWAADVAGIDDLKRLGRLQVSSHACRQVLLYDMASELSPDKSSSFHDGFIEGALAVWTEVKDKI